MEEVKYEVELRPEIGKNKVKALKEKQLIPAIVYGNKQKPMPISVNPQQLAKFYKGPYRKNVIIDLTVLDPNTKNKLNYRVITYQITRDVISRAITHIDFLIIDNKVPIKIAVPIQYIGTAPGIKHGGVLIKRMSALNITCLPDKLPATIDVDISDLEVGDLKKIKDLPQSKDYDILSSSNDVLVRIETSKKAKSEDLGGEEGAEAIATEGEEAAAAETENDPNNA
jgi:large subunit ribosomal protein L25